MKQDKSKRDNETWPEWRIRRKAEKEASKDEIKKPNQLKKGYFKNDKMTMAYHQNTTLSIGRLAIKNQEDLKKLTSFAKWNTIAIGALLGTVIVLVIRIAIQN